MAEDAFLAAIRAELARGTKIQRESLAEIVAALEEARRGILAELAGQPTDYRRWSITRLLTEIDRALAEAQARAAAALTAGLRDSEAAGADLVDVPMRLAGIEVGTLFPRLSPPAIAAVDAGALKHAAGITTAIRRGIERTLRQVVIGTVDPWQASQAVGRILTEGGRARAQTIVRTELGRAYAAAGQDRMEQASVLAPALQKQWRRSGKRLSRMEHDAIDGQVRAVTEAFLVDGEALMFPRDPKGSARNTINCGCVSIPHLPGWRQSRPGRQAFTPAEIAADPRKKWLEDALGGPPGEGGPTIATAPAAVGAAAVLAGMQAATGGPPRRTYKDYGRPRAADVPPERRAQRPPRDLTIQDRIHAGMSPAAARQAVIEEFRRIFGLGAAGEPGIVADPTGLDATFDYRALAHLFAKPEESRERIMSEIRAAIEQPYEIWSETTRTRSAADFHTRTYIGLFDDRGGAVKVVMGQYADGWRMVTAMRVDRIDRARRGSLVYGR